MLAVPAQRLLTMLGIPAIRFGVPRYRSLMEPDPFQRQEWQIVQSWLNLRDFLQ